MTKDAPQAPSGSGQTPGLPLDVVDRSAAANAKDDNGGLVWRIFRKVRFIPLIMLLVACGGVIGLYFQPPGLKKVFEVFGLEPGAGTSNPIAVPVKKAKKDEAAKPDKPGTIVGLGTLLPEGDVITIAPPFGSGDARLRTLLVEEGEQVKQGQILAVLDNDRVLKAVVDGAKANLAVRQANLEQTRISVRASINEARAALARAQSAARNTQSELERAKKLIEKRVVSEAVLDQKRAATDQALREVDQAIATLSRYETDDIEAQVDVIVAARNLDAAQVELNRATRDLDKAYARAPIAGTVLKVHVRPGENPGATGILNLGNIEHMTVKVEVYQTQISQVSTGDKVTISANALPEVLHGTVSKIGLKVGRQVLIDDDPAANTDARIVEVRVVLDEPSSLLASRFTNLQVVARITPEARQ